MDVESQSEVQETQQTLAQGFPVCQVRQGV